jgi:hypothetical protein
VSGVGGWVRPRIDFALSVDILDSVIYIKLLQEYFEMHRTLSRSLSGAASAGHCQARIQESELGRVTKYRHRVVLDRPPQDEEPSGPRTMSLPGASCVELPTKPECLTKQKPCRNVVRPMNGRTPASIPGGFGGEQRPVFSPRWTGRTLDLSWNVL